MKKILWLFGCLAFLTSAQAQLKTPAPSPTQTLKQDFGLGSIEINYSRPAVKGRKVFGDLVPYVAIWRTGANNATTLQFSDEVSIGGVTLAPGKYGLLSIPDKDKWTLIISKQTDVTSPSAYKPEMDLVRVTASVEKLKYTVENFTIAINDIKPNSCQLSLSWDKTQVNLPITTDIDSKIMSNIAKVMQGEKPPYYNAAMYYMDNGKDLNQALAWFDKAIEATPGAYWVHHQRANCLAKLGKSAEARAAAEKSKELALAAKNMDYVKLNEKLLAELK
jgi:tetratricopeptide (TPR) repeat protein